VRRRPKRCCSSNDENAWTANPPANESTAKSPAIATPHRGRFAGGGGAITRAAPTAPLSRPVAYAREDPPRRPAPGSNADRSGPRPHVAQQRRWSRPPTPPGCLPAAALAFTCRAR
jgi:hypothetical protein